MYSWMALSSRSCLMTLMLVVSVVWGCRPFMQPRAPTHGHSLSTPLGLCADATCLIFMFSSRSWPGWTALWEAFLTQARTERGGEGESDDVRGELGGELDGEAPGRRGSFPTTSLAPLPPTDQRQHRSGKRGHAPRAPAGTPKIRTRHTTRRLPSPSGTTTPNALGDPRLSWVRQAGGTYPDR
jgi:hypothetical protein